MWIILFRAFLLWALFWACSVSSIHAESQYYGLAAAPSDFSGPLDQRGLNRSLTASDRITVQQGHFFKVGEDGQPGTADDRRARLYGVNLSYSANFPDHERARQIARRLRNLGFNAVRLHHLDSLRDNGVDDFHSVLLPGPFPTFNLKAIERLKFFLKALKDEGIYANLNLYVAYRFRPDVDKIPPLEGMNIPLVPSSAVQVFHPKLIALQATYARELIRLLGLGNDPMLAMVEIRNESSLASAWQAWGTQKWSEAIRGDYAVELTRQWNSWLVQTYGSVETACQRWADCVTLGSQPLVSPTEADVLRTGQRAGFLGKAVDKLRAWSGLSGSLEEGDGRGQRFFDFARFIIDTDKHYFEEMRRAVRTVASPLVPITGTQMSFGGPMNYLSQSTMDYLDDHFYIDHYNFPKAAWDANDWRINDTRLPKIVIDDLTELSTIRDLNRPFVVSEYNQPYPNRQGAAITPLIALVGALQDWDGLFHFDYIDGNNWGVMPSGFRLSGDWAKLAVVGQSAQIFRTDLIPPLSVQSPTLLEANAILRIGALRQREDRGLVVMPKPAEKMFQARLGSALAVSNSKKPSFVVPSQSKTWKIAYEEGEERLSFSGPRLAGFIGKYAPGQQIDVGSLIFEPLDPLRAFATVLVTSLDEKPISKSEHLLISVPGHVMGSQPGALPPRPKRLVPYENTSDWWTLEPDPLSNGKPSGALVGQEPLWMERVPLKVTLRTNANDAKVFPLSLTGKRLGQLPATSVVKLADSYEFKLQMEAAPQSPWYEIVLNPASVKK